MAVAAGAYASHGMTDVQAVSWAHTASQYQMWHALALIAVTVLFALNPPPAPGQGRAALTFLAIAGWAFVAGLILFPGSLYVLAITGDRSLGALAPAGGIALMAGWLGLALAGLNWRRRGDWM